jgi:hypothetical protein
MHVISYSLLYMDAHETFKYHTSSSSSILGSIFICNVDMPTN